MIIRSTDAANYLRMNVEIPIRPRSVVQSSMEPDWKGPQCTFELEILLEESRSDEPRTYLNGKLLDGYDPVRKAMAALCTSGFYPIPRLPRNIHLNILAQVPIAPGQLATNRAVLPDYNLDEFETAIAVGLYYLTQKRDVPRLKTLWSSRIHLDGRLYNGECETLAELIRDLENRNIAFVDYSEE